MTKIVEPSEQALRVRDQILNIILAENDQTGDTRSVFHGIALAFGQVLSSVQPNPAYAAAWMEGGAQSIRLTGEPEGPLQ